MSNELMPFDANQLPSTDLVTLQDLDTITQGSDFIQRIQLITKGKYVDNGKIAPGRYGVPQSGGEDLEIVDLGAEIDIIPFAVRAKALDMRDKEAIIAVYDRNNPTFKEIEELAEESNSGCMCGASFLVFERATAKFYEYYMGNKSGRRESGKLTPFLNISEEAAEATNQEAHGPLPCTLKIRYIKRPTYGWHVPVVNRCSEPFTNLPSTEAIVAEIDRFVSAKENGVERVTEPAGEEAGRAR